MNDIETMTVEEVANLLRVDERTIYRKCEMNEIPHFRVGETGSIRFVKDKILQWINDQHANA